MVIIMLAKLKEQSNLTRTENGCVAYRSTMSDCLDFFATCGALRHESEGIIIKKFVKAYAENPDYSMKILFYARDIRKGLGERRLFNVIIRYLSKYKPRAVIKNLKYFDEFGRFDDILSLLDTKCEVYLGNYIKYRLKNDMANLKNGRGVSLLAKWLPSVNTSSEQKIKQAKKICSLLKISEKEYRKTLSALRSKIAIVEDAMRRKDYSFDYESIPGKALFKYRRAFLNNDSERYRCYLQRVNQGNSKINTSVLYPYEIVNAAMKSDSESDTVNSLNTLWDNLPLCTEQPNALAVIDGSASMYSTYSASVTPISVAISLGIYFAERCKGRFANHFITFSNTPRLVKIKGNNIVDKVRYCMSYNEIANTDLYEVFMLILITAIKNNLDQSELPEIIYVISDMEFDSGVSEDKTVFEDAKEKFSEYGYKLPQIVYWNVCSRSDNFPVTMDENGVGLVSGWSPSIFSLVTSHNLSPYSLMNSIINSDRYAKISA